VLEGIDKVVTFRSYVARIKFQVVILTCRVKMLSLGNDASPRWCHVKRLGTGLVLDVDVDVC
jgi:hypothetical protein